MTAVDASYVIEIVFWDVYLFSWSVNHLSLLHYLLYESPHRITGGRPMLQYQANQHQKYISCVLVYTLVPTQSFNRL